MIVGRAKLLGLAMALGLVAVGCSTAPTNAPVPPGLTVDCGPVQNPGLCRSAVATVLSAKLNPPAASVVTLRLSTPGDDCRTWFHACETGMVIGVIQSGDTLQDVPIIRTADGWTRLDLVR